MHFLKEANSSNTEPVSPVFYFSCSVDISSVLTNLFLFFSASPPPEAAIFERRRKYGVPVWMSRHPGLNDYIYQVRFQLSLMSVEFQSPGGVLRWGTGVWMNWKRIRFRCSPTPIVLGPYEPSCKGHHTRDYLNLLTSYEERLFPKSPECHCVFLVYFVRGLSSSFSGAITVALLPLVSHGILLGTLTHNQVLLRTKNLISQGIVRKILVCFFEEGTHDESRVLEKVAFELNMDPKGTVSGLTSKRQDKDSVDQSTLQVRYCPYC